MQADSEGDRKHDKTYKHKDSEPALKDPPPVTIQVRRTSPSVNKGFLPFIHCFLTSNKMESFTEHPGGWKSIGVTARQAEHKKGVL